MRRTQTRAVALAALLALTLALPAAVGAGTRIPVNSTDDASSPTANRIAAVTNIVNATNARVLRVAAAYPRNPCNDLNPELLSMCLAAAGAVDAYSTLGQSVADACAAIPLSGPGDTVISDADAFASDTSTTGIANQFASIAMVLGNANDRLGGIRVPDPGPPDLTALTALAAAVELGGTAAAGCIGTAWPPNPCTPGTGY